MSGEWMEPAWLRRTALGGLVWSLGIILWITWMPTGTGPSRITIQPPDRLLEVIGNLFLFAPVAIALTVGRRNPASSGSRAVFHAAIIICGLSLLVELGQLRVASRTVSPFDVALNSGGGAAVAWATLGMRRAGMAIGGFVALAFGALLLSMTLMLATTGFAASRMLRLSHWDATYTILAGDELGGGRRYPGSVENPRICAGPPDLETCTGPGADLDERERLAALAESSQSIRLSGTVTFSPIPERPTLGRIVTFSSGPYHRNATLEQTDEVFSLRIRTPIGGPNGFSFDLPHDIPTGVPVQVRGSYVPGRVALSYQGADGGDSQVFRWGLLSGWWLLYRPGFAHVNAASLEVAGVIGAGMLSFALGLLADGLQGRVPYARLFAAAALPPLLLLLLAVSLDSPVHPTELAAAIGFGSLGGLFSRLRGRARA